MIDNMDTNRINIGVCVVDSELYIAGDERNV
jgi:hypothetical protein